MSLIESTVNYGEDGSPDGAPTYLFDQAETYRRDPRDAALEWFAHARLGISIHYGLTTLLGAPEDPADHQDFDLEQYRLLPGKFSCRNFNPVDISELAIAAGARYVAMPAKTKDGFCLFDSQRSEYTSVRTEARRDLVGEMASVCEYHGLGLCLSYPLTRDWLNDREYDPREDAEAGTDTGADPGAACLRAAEGPLVVEAGAGKDAPAPGTSSARPGKERREGVSQDCCEQYLVDDLPDESDFSPALRDALEDIRHLLTQYGPVAALKIEGQGQVARRPNLRKAFRIIARRAALLQPQILVSLEQGLTGDETFYSVDRSIPRTDSPDDVQGLVHKDASKPLELRFPMSPGSFSYSALQAGRHLDGEGAWELLRETLGRRSNLLLHTCLMPDGSLDLEDIGTLLDLGRKIERRGYPC